MSTEQENLIEVQPAATSNITAIAIASIMPDTLIVNYTGLPGNMPGAYGNFITVFNSPAPQFPFGAGAPIATAQVTGNTTGSIALQGNFQAGTSYIAGYAAGPKTTGGAAQPYANVCATAFIPGSGGDAVTAVSTHSLNYLSSNMIVCRYDVLPGLTPGANGAWAGLWMGNMPSYSTPPQSSVPVNDSSSSGSIVFNNLAIMRGALYSIAFFMSGWEAGGKGSVQTAMACTLQFAT
jgi:hypothetical protein